MLDLILSHCITMPNVFKSYYFGGPMIDFSLSKEQTQLKEKVETFIRDKIIPLEDQYTQQAPKQVDDEFRKKLVALAREEGLVAPHVAKEYGGMGLNHVDMSIAFIAAGYSQLGPLAMNCAAPDEGNMNLLSKVASEEQKDRWLRPLVSGDIRSCFAMTEPAPGAGSDPSAMQTTVRLDGNHFVVNGRKWLISGADGAGFAIIMGRPDGETEGATMLLADMDTPGIKIVRDIPTTDKTFPGGHCEVVFEDVRIPATDVLGAPGEGFKYAQVRLAPARLTHCMRWLGAAQRCNDIAVDYAKKREVFGRRLVDHEGVGFQLADNAMDSHLCQLSIWHTAWLLDQGNRAGRESSMSKVMCSEAQFRMVDRSQQILGGMGVTHDTVVAQIATELRAFRIYDGPSEVHRWSLARRIGR